MAHGNVSGELAEADSTAIRNAIVLITQKLPFLINLSDSEMQKAAKFTGKDSEAIIDSKFAIANHPLIFPGTFDKAEFQRDAALFELVREFAMLIASLARQLQCTEIGLGDDLRKSMSVIRKCVNEGAKTNPELKPLADKMNERFKGQGKKKKNGPPLL
jgi:hypothetical protein